MLAGQKKHTVSSNPTKISSVASDSQSSVIWRLTWPYQQFYKDNLSIPVIGSPLFIISNPDLVIAQCKAGVIGSFPALNARPEPVLEEWLDRITSELKDHDKNNPDNKAAPFAVNQIVHGSNARLKHDMDM